VRERFVCRVMCSALEAGQTSQLKSAKQPSTGASHPKYWFPASGMKWNMISRQSRAFFLSGRASLSLWTLRPSHESRLPGTWQSLSASLSVSFLPTGVNPLTVGGFWGSQIIYVHCSTRRLLTWLVPCSKSVLDCSASAKAHVFLFVSDVCAEIGG
jgi:hypothetical protein